jgi:hypothetical protein
MKKLILVIVLVFALTACDTGQTEGLPESQDTPQGATEIGALPTESPPPAHNGGETGTEPPGNYIPQTDLTFSFKLGNNTIEMDQSMTTVIEMLGEPRGVFEAPSCAFDGIDRVFSYPGVQIHTYPGTDDDYVHTISLRDDSVRTDSGIYLGMGFEAVIEAYGSDYTHESGMYTYTRSRTTLAFFIEDDMIIGITYGLIME